MALAMVPINNQITTKLKELPQDVYETSIPDDSVVRYDTNGLMLPYIVAVYSGFVQLNMERGITGPRQDLGQAYARFMCVAPTDQAARVVADAVTDKLTGFQPTDAGMLMPEVVGKPYAMYDSNSRPMKYVVEVTYKYAVNTVVS